MLCQLHLTRSNILPVKAFYNIYSVSLKELSKVSKNNPDDLIKSLVLAVWLWGWQFHSVSPSLWSRLKYLDDYWMDFHVIC